MKKILLIGLLGLVSCEANAMFTRAIRVVAPAAAVGAGLSECKTDSEESKLEMIERAYTLNDVDRKQAYDLLRKAGMSVYELRACESSSNIFNASECECAAKKFDQIGQGEIARELRKRSANLSLQKCALGSSEYHCKRAAEKYKELIRELLEDTIPPFLFGLGVAIGTVAVSSARA